MDIPPLDLAMKTRTAQVLERCVACGACAEVCPMPGPAGIDASNPGEAHRGHPDHSAWRRASRMQRVGPRCAPAAGIAFRNASTASIRASC